MSLIEKPYNFYLAKLAHMSIYNNLNVYTEKLVCTQCYKIQ